MYLRCESSLKNVFMIAGGAVIIVGVIGSVVLSIIFHLGLYFAFYGILASLFVGGMLLFAYEVLDILETTNNNLVQLGNKLEEADQNKQ